MRAFKLRLPLLLCLLGEEFSKSLLHVRLRRQYQYVLAMSVLREDVS